MKRLKHLREERARIEGEMNSIFATCETENRSRTPEEKTKWEKLNADVEAMSEEIRALEEQEKINSRSARPVASGSNPGSPERASQPLTMEDSIRNWVEKNKETIDAILNGEQRSLPELEIRAAANPMTIATTNSGSSILLPNMGVLNGVNDLNRTKPTFWSRLRKGSTDLNPLPWANKTNKQGSAQFIGEGVLKPLASFEITVETSVAKKVAERFRVSTELLHDVKGIKSLIENEATFEVDVASNTAVLIGTASSTMPAGITTIASAFTLTTVETTNPSNLDAIRAAKAQLQTLNFDRDIVAFINPVDAANMDMAKGTDGHYMIPPFTSSNGTTISGVTIIEDNNIAAGYLLIGDMSKYKIDIVEDLSIKWGYDSDDFSKNLITMIAERRFHQYFSANNTGAFIYDDFAGIKTAITA